MLRNPNKSTRRSLPVRALAIAGVAGVHVAVVGTLLATPAKHQPALSDAQEIQFVEIGPEPVAAAPMPEAVPAQPPLPEPEPTPEPPPEPDPAAIAPEFPKPKPKPKPIPKPAKPPVKSTPLAEQSQTAAAPVSAPTPGPVTSTPEGPAAVQADPSKPRLIGRVDYLGARPSPEYPRVSQRRGEAGRVVVRVLISPQGSVDQASVRTSSGFERLDESALKAARLARFKPYTENGVAYPALADIPFDFVL